MYKFIALFSLLLSLSCVQQHNPDQSYALVEQQQVTTLESADYSVPDVNDEHQAVLPGFLQFASEAQNSSNSFRLVESRVQLVFQRPNIRAPPLVS